MGQEDLTSWGWWDEWNDTALQDSKFESWRSEAEHATSRSRRLPRNIESLRVSGEEIFCFFETWRPEPAISDIPSRQFHCTRAPVTRGKATGRINYISMTHLLLKLTNSFEYKCSRPRWLNRLGCGSKGRSTGFFISTLGRMFFIGFVHIQCSKLFKGLECTVLSMVLCTIKNPWSHSIRVGHSPGFGLSSVAMLPWLCRKRREAILLTHSWM